MLVSATVPATAPPTGAEQVTVDGHDLPIEAMLTRLASIVDVAGLPALSVPAGLSPSGLPTGVQVIGRRYEETAVLRVGAAIEMPLPDPP